MTNNNYLIAVFVCGKNELLVFSEKLDELVTIEVLYKDGNIYIYDIRRFRTLADKEVRDELRNARTRWLRSLFKKDSPDEWQGTADERPKKVKLGWERRVKCRETGQIFRSIRECSEKTGIPYMTISNCIKNGNATRGVHFENVVVEHEK